MEILVATSHDFALLRDGRPVMGGAWDDVLHARASAAAGVVRLALALRGGAEFVARDDAPGWDDLLEAAESARPGMRRARDWVPALAGGAAALDLFARGAR
jgi:hypothetical protein